MYRAFSILGSLDIFEVLLLQGHKKVLLTFDLLEDNLDNEQRQVHNIYYLFAYYLSFCVLMNYLKKENNFGPKKEEIGKYKGFGYAITSDIWTANFLKSSYVSCTMHYVMGGVLKNRLLSIKSMENDNCTGSNIKVFGCYLQHDKPIEVTDRGSNMLTAFSRDLHINCFHHLLNNIIEKAIKSMPEINELVMKCSRLVKYFKKSGDNSKLSIRLKSHCPTRWNTVYYLLKSIEDNSEEILNILTEKNENARIDDIHFKEVGSLVTTLAEFEDASKILEGSKKPTIHLTIPYVFKLKKDCVSYSTDTKTIIEFKANKLLQIAEVDKNQMFEKCKEIMIKCLSRHNNKPLQQKAPTINKVLAGFLRIPSEINTLNNVEMEMQTYANIHVEFSDDLDCIEWWDLHKIQFPLLFETSCKILSIPTSSAG